MKHTVHDLHDTLYQWVSKGKFFGGDRFSLTVLNASFRKQIALLRIWTESNLYQIRAEPAAAEDGDPYLACEVSARKPLPGENWTRGADLSDGSFSEKTFAQIMLDIVSYEAKEIARAAQG